MCDSGQGPLETLRITVLPLTADSFAPFGEVLAASDRPPDFTGISSAGWRSSFASASPPEVMTYRSRFSGFRFRMLERHHYVTQTFIPLGGAPAIVAVAAPTAADDVPRPQDVRAFLLDGSAGYVLYAGTWHSLDRYPLNPPHADIVIVTDRETQRELEANPGGPWERTESADYAERFGIEFELEM